MHCHLRLRIAIVGLAFLTVSFLTPASGDVILEVSDDGTDLTLGWTGNIDLGNPGSTLGGNNADFYSADSTTVYAEDGPGNLRSFGAIGATSGNDPWIAATTFNFPSLHSGTAFGFLGGQAVWDDSFGVSPGVINPTASWTFDSLTVATAFGTNLDSGPVLLWTHGTTGDTISVGLASSAVPEPSAFLLLCVGALGFTGYRRRKHSQSK